jgi:hypothetical protein
MTPKVAWIDELKTNGLIPDIEILEIVDGEGWVDAEKDWIARGRECGWPLTNLTGGGEGYSNSMKANALIEKCRYLGYIDIDPDIIASMTTEEKWEHIIRAAKLGIQEMRNDIATWKWHENL